MSRRSYSPCVMCLISWLVSHELPAHRCLLARTDLVQVKATATMAARTKDFLINMPGFLRGVCGGCFEMKVSILVTP